MTDYLGGLLSLAFPTILGWSLVRVFDRRQVLSEPERLSLGGVLGIGFLAWWMLLLDWMAVPFTRSNILIPMGFVSLAGIFRKNLPINRCVGKLPRVGPVEIMLLAIIGFQLLTTILFSLLTPIEAHDAVFNWGLKAKAIFLARGVPMGLLETSFSPNPTYPLLFPLAQSYVSLFLGHYNDFSSKWVCVVLLFSFLSFLYLTLSRLGASLRTSLFSMLMICTVPLVREHLANGYADLPVGIYFGMAGICFYLWVQEHMSLFIVLAAQLSAFAALTKNEGATAAALLFCLFSARMLLTRGQEPIAERAKWIIAFLAILGVLLLPWLHLKVSLESTQNIAMARAPLPRFEWRRLDRILPIFSYYQLQWFGLRNWNLLWILFLVGIVSRFKEVRRSDLTSVGLLIFGQLLIYTLFYILVPDESHPVMNLRWYLVTTVSRMLLQLTPLTVFFLGSLLASSESPGP
jgi:hypothetical protein